MTEINSAAHSNSIDGSRNAQASAGTSDGSFQGVLSSAVQLQDAAASVFYSMLLFKDVQSTSSLQQRPGQFNSLGSLVSELRTLLGLSAEESTTAIQTQLKGLSPDSQEYAKHVHSFIFSLAKLEDVSEEKRAHVSTLLSEIQEELDRIRAARRSQQFFNSVSTQGLPGMLQGQSGSGMTQQFGGMFQNVLGGGLNLDIFGNSSGDDDDDDPSLNLFNNMITGTTNSFAAQLSQFGINLPFQGQQPNLFSDAIDDV